MTDETTHWHSAQIVKKIVRDFVRTNFSWIEMQIIPGKKNSCAKFTFANIHVQSDLTIHKQRGREIGKTKIL